MKKRIVFVLTTITLAAALTFAAFAQGKGNADQGPGAKPVIHTDKNPVGTQVKLGCTLGGASEFPTITITNNVNASIPKGTKLYWQVNNSMKGVYELKHELFKGMSVHFDTEAKGTGGSLTAWYFKQ